MWDTWNVHRMMSQTLVKEATPTNLNYPNATLIGEGNLNHDTTMLCETYHKAQAWFTGEGRALEDYIFIDYKLTDSEGIENTGQHSENAADHKIKYTIYYMEDDKWETAFQNEVIGDTDGWATSSLHLIPKGAIYKITIKSIDAGECAEPSGTKEIGRFTALEEKPDCGYQNRETLEDEECGECNAGYEENADSECVIIGEEPIADPSDMTPLITALAVIGGVALILKKKAKKAKAK